MYPGNEMDEGKHAGCHCNFVLSLQSMPDKIYQIDLFYIQNLQESCSAMLLCANSERGTILWQCIEVCKWKRTFGLNSEFESHSRILNTNYDENVCYY